MDIKQKILDTDDQSEHLSRGKAIILYKCPFCRSGRLNLCYEAKGESDILIEKGGRFLAFALGSLPYVTKTMLYVYEPSRNCVKRLDHRENWKCEHCDVKCQFDGYNLRSPDRPEKICVEDAHQFGDRFNFDNRERLFEQLKEKAQKYEKIHD